MEEIEGIDLDDDSKENFYLKEIKLEDSKPEILSEKEYIRKDPNKFVMRSHIIEKYRKLGFRTSYGVFKVFDYLIAKIMKDSCRRAKGNDRVTILARDL